jgi:hypothetical protein
MRAQRETRDAVEQGAGAAGIRSLVLKERRQLLRRAGGGELAAELIGVIADHCREHLHGAGQRRNGGDAETEHRCAQGGGDDGVGEKEVREGLDGGLVTRREILQGEIVICTLVDKTGALEIRGDKEMEIRDGHTEGGEGVFLGARKRRIRWEFVVGSVVFCGVWGVFGILGVGGGG